jgi:hypothetical protein
MVAIWWQQGIIVMSYINDFVVLVSSRGHALTLHNQFITALLNQLGWVHEETKG